MVYAASPMKIRKLLFAVVVPVVAFSACDLINRTSNQVQAKKVIVGTLLHTPPIQIEPEAVAGFDASFPFLDAGFTFDGGFPFDAGVFLNDGGAAVTVPAQTIVFAYFGTRNGEGLSQEAPTAIEGATMTLTRKGSSALNLKDSSQGSFGLTSSEEPALTYEAHASYLFTASAEGTTFVGIVEDVPEEEKVAAFRPGGKSFISLAAGSEFQFARPDPPNGKERNLAFVVVVPISREGQQGEPTYTNVPSTPLGYLKLAVAPSDWKTTTVTIPGTAFPQKDTNYLILLQSAKLGRPDTDNLFIGSAMIAGTADVGVVKTH